MNPKYYRKSRDAEKIREIKMPEVGLMKCKIDGTVIFIDDSTFGMLELEHQYSEPSEIIGKKIMDLIIQSPNEEIEISKITETCLAYPKQYTFQTLSGANKLALISSSLIIDDESSEKIVQMTLQDMTAFTNHGQDFCDFKKMHQNVIEAIPFGVFTIGRDYRFKSVNTLAARLIRTTPEKLIGKSLFETFPKEVAERRLNLLKEIYETGEPYIIDQGHIITDRGYRWFTVSLLPMKGEDPWLDRLMACIECLEAHEVVR